MNDEREIARLTFWMGADAAKEYAAHLTEKRKAAEIGAVLPVHVEEQDYE